MTAALRTLLEAAESAGVAAPILQRAAVELVELQLRIADLERCQNPRKRQTLAMAARIKAADRAMREAGTPDRVRALCDRFTVRRSRLYELLKVSGQTPDSSAG